MARLPRAVRPQPSLSRNPAPFRARRKRGTASASRATAERVLLIEDDFLVVNQIEAALIDASFEIAGVGSSADEAIELASSLRPTLCVMDIRLGGGRDGIEAAIEITGRMPPAASSPPRMPRARRKGRSARLAAKTLFEDVAGRRRPRRRARAARPKLTSPMACPASRVTFKKCL